MACRIAAFQLQAWLPLRPGSPFFFALKPESDWAVRANYPDAEKERDQDDNFFFQQPNECIQICDYQDIYTF